ncbi:MAG: hypothetical protein CME62_03365 [Halobacteriovoraceae bacterium]|nr:hypothetical protein [Halobacteriovoraceae bacterium]|tara:strand:+ start:26261 stop:27073 length:813 start_codon:yes stop_codon:yes gene_type:complete
MKIGHIRKLKSVHNPKDNSVSYNLPLEGEGQQSIALNEHVGSKLKLVHTGLKKCIASDKVVKKTYGQGYSWESYMTLAQCDQCIFQPELCHYAKGTCREPEWGEANCMQPHVVYLSVTSDLKIGITRKVNVPTRWVDQGAVAAIPLFEVKNRLTSGLVEVEIAKNMSDKTNWRNMLKNKYPEVDLLAEKKKLIKEFSELLGKHEITPIEDQVYNFIYPVEKYPEKVKSLNFDKDPEVGGTLLGIKGQYLIFDTGVINMRKFQGYEIEVHC